MRFGSRAFAPVFITISAFLVACTQSGLSEDELEPDFLAYINTAESDILATQNFQLYRSHIFDQAAQEEAKSFSVNLESGKQYWVEALCDGDCLDMELYLLKDGELVESDTAKNAFPMMEFELEDGGSYELISEISDCKADLCQYAIMFYVKDTS